MHMITFGSNTFGSKAEFTAVGVDETGALIIGAFGAPPKTRLVWVTFTENSAAINADIADGDNEMVLQIRDNVITINEDNVYTVQFQPDDKTPPDRVTVLNQYGETALDLWREGDTWNLNADFYHGRWHVVASPKGTEINPSTPRV